MIILRQKSYSGSLGRSIKNWAGNRIEKSINKDSRELQESSRRYFDTAGEINLPEIDERIIGRERRNAAVFEVSELGNINLPNKVAREKETIAEIAEKLGPDLAKKIEKAAKEGKDIVFHPKDSGTGSLAHELGHAKNNRSIIKKPFIKKNTETRPEFIDTISSRSGKGFRTGIKRYIKGKSIVLEERDANKKGIKILRRAGIDDDTLDRIQRSYRDSLQTYKSASNIYYKAPIMNRLRS